VVTDDFYHFLMRQSWPGNVRELRNLLERLLLTCEDGVLDANGVARPPDAESLAPSTLAAADALGATSTVSGPRDDDKQRIATALIATGGNIARAARRLDLPRSTLRYRIRRHSLSSLIPDD
jgi:transcriptional regulator of acetoin/glycerol metabolism